MALKTNKKNQLEMQLLVGSVNSDKLPTSVSFRFFSCVHLYTTVFLYWENITISIYSEVLVQVKGTTDLHKNYLILLVWVLNYKKRRILLEFHL